MTRRGRNPSQRSAPTFISVVIPAFNVAHTLSDQLAALAAQSYEGMWEVIVADNGSTDATRDVVEHWSVKLPRLRLADASSKRGVNPARNAGAAKANGELLIFCDADDVATRSWLSEMAASAMLFDLVGGSIDHSTLNDPVVRPWRPCTQSESLPRLPNYLSYSVGANLGVWADVFEAIGGWNEDYNSGGDDPELCLRAQLAGYTIGFSPKAVMMYRHRTGVASLARQYYGYGVAGPKLFKQFRAHGMPRRPLVKGLKSYGKLFADAYFLASTKRRGDWIRRASFKWGVLVGCLRYRVLAL